MYWRSLSTIAGLALILIGIPMLVCPGPGVLAITTGFALLLTGRVPAHSGKDRAAGAVGRGPIDVPYRIRKSDRHSENEGGGDEEPGRSRAQ